jgi:hypothetical protein
MNLRCCRASRSMLLLWVAVFTPIARAQHHTPTNAERNFSLPLLQPGQYRVSASAPQMQTGAADVELLVGGRREIAFVLQPTTAQTTIQVTGQVSNIETASSELKSNIDSRQVMNLHLDGRTFASLGYPRRDMIPDHRRIGRNSRQSLAR